MRILTHTCRTLYPYSVLRTHIIHTDTGGTNGTYRFLHNAFLIRLVCPRLQFRGSHEAAMADARTQIGKSLCALTGRDSDAYLDTWDLGLAPIGLPKPNSHQHPPHHSKDLKSSAAPQTPNPPYAIQVKLGLSDWTIDRLKRMTSPRDPISPDTYPK